MSNILDNLNLEQQLSLVETEGAFLVTAGAGSGKTRLLTHRIAYLINDKNISPERILAITFTNKAANEMKERVKALVSNGERVWASTFHSMCAKMLRQDIDKLGGNYTRNFSIYSESDVDKILKELFTEFEITEDSLKKKVKYYISACKNEGMTALQFEHNHEYDPDIKECMQVLERYNQKLQQNNALDFDDLLTKTVELFQICPEVLKKYQERFLYILVDEFQDTNAIQFQMVKMLADLHKNIFVVGDEDQCIYTWRGANFQNIFNFKDAFENVKIYKLEHNYRSTEVILDLANKLIANNSSRLDKKLWTDKKGGTAVEFKTPYDEQEEAEIVASTIHYLVINKGYKYSDFAVLMRLNALTLPFEEKFLSYNIPHRIFGGFKFFERAEIKNVLSYLRLFANPHDNVSFMRVINFPKRGIGNSSLQKLADMAENNNTSMLNCVLKFMDMQISDPIINKFIPFAKTYQSLYANYELMPLDEFVADVISMFGIKQAYQGKEEDLEKASNIDALMGSVAEFVSKNEGLGLVEYLESVSLISDLDGMDESNNVTIATVHSVKGLEFKCVFIIGFEENIFPLSRAKSDGELEEERRLAYVAITRAEERLFISACRTRYMYGRRDYMIPSRFVGEAGLGAKRVIAVPKPKTNFDFIMPSTEKKNIIKKDISRYRIGMSVSHPKFGNGVIQSISESIADINFSGLGVKTLILDIAPLTIIKED